METPFDVLTHVALLAREQEISKSVSTPSRTPSPVNSDPDSASSASASRRTGVKRKAEKARLVDERQKKRTPPAAAAGSAEYPATTTGSGAILNIQRRSPPPPLPHAPPPGVATPVVPTTLSPCSCCGGPIHYSLPLRPTPYSLAPPPPPAICAPSHFSYYARPPPSSPHFHYPSQFKSSEASAFSPISRAVAAPLVYSAGSPPFSHHKEKTPIARPLPIRPRGTPPDLRFAPTPLSYKKEETCQAGAVTTRKAGKKTPTDMNIDEHFKRSLQGDRLRQFYPYPTDDKGSVENHFKRALGDEWNKVKEVENEQEKNNSLLSLRMV
ncbi:uncharacterized protein [Oscarella lobularis]|uniref:uncharacterized protein n=1 Tax=Oscarella lobularis TaxID=121494 RepID=UPI003313F495